jgi:hypothetical protein
MKKTTLIFLAISLAGRSIAQPMQIDKINVKDQFKTPPFEYRAIAPFQGAGGSKYLETENTTKQLDNIFNTYGYGGVMIAPTDDKPFVGKHLGEPSYLKHIGNGLQKSLPKGASPWLMTLPAGGNPYRGEPAVSMPKGLKPFPLPAYLSEAYYKNLKEILDYAKQNGRKVIFYEEIGYPSGITNHSTPEKYRRKVLEKIEEPVTGAQNFKKTITSAGEIMAIVAMNTASGKRIDLTPTVKNNQLNWKVPKGNWKLMQFNCVNAKASGGELDYPTATDYLDPEAVKWFVDQVYEPHAKVMGEHLGTTVFQTFFDDVGIFDEERTWTAKFNEKFKARFGVNPAIYYPALWENVGQETNAARVAFFETRAELLADGFPKIVTDWGKRNKVQVSGHCPGNYDPQPVDMNGDPFKFYRAQDIPMVDVIFGYPTGRDGFKLVSDGADFYDKPIVAAETFSSFSPPGQTAGYRRLMELYVRGINRLMGSGLPKSDVLGGTTTFAEWVGRNSMMLQGGKRVSEIAIFYPIADLEAYYHFDAPEYTKEMRWGTFVPYNNDFLAIGEMLLGEVHRDFSFMHPDFLLSDKIKLNGSTLELQNKVNNQTYKALILPGQTVISLKALQKIKAYYDQGGIVIATSLLPSKAAELTGDAKTTSANDRKVQAIIKEMFGIDATKPMPDGVLFLKSNKMNGKTVFIRKPSGVLLKETLEKLNIDADVIFENNPSPLSGGGMFSYLHKQKDNQEIYYFANSSDDAIETFAEVRGKIIPELWNPENGETTQIKEVVYSKKNGQDYTRFPLKLKPVGSTFVVSALKNE